MKGWILDTNVLSELRRKRPDAAVEKWMKSEGLEALHTTAVNIAELHVGISSQPSQVDSRRLAAWLEESIRPLFHGRILDVTEDALFAWRVLSRDIERRQRLAPAVDLLIAAVAMSGGMGVATRDTKPFVGTGVQVLNPWTGERFNGA